MSKYLITGGTGFIGRVLVKRLIDGGANDLVVLARNEGNLIELKEEFPSINIIPGDVADLSIVQKACYGVDGIFHLAAFKYVGLAEANPYQCSKSNVIGTMNLLNESQKIENGFFVFISTDKASRVSGVYSASKAKGEILVKEAALKNPSTKYTSIRFGNVWGSTGSVAVKWEKAMRGGREVYITDPDATRFFFSVNEAVSVILNNVRTTGTITPKMKAVRMGVVLEACQERFGKCPVGVAGLQAGENLHETMDGSVFSNEVDQFTKDEFTKEFLGD